MPDFAQDFAKMDRRAAMRNIGLLLGAVSMPTLANCVEAAQAPGALDEPRLKLLTAIADTIIPVTDTPGAVAAGVPRLLSGLLANWASAETRKELVGAIDAIGQLASAGRFADLPFAERTALLRAYDTAAIQYAPPRGPKLTGIAALLAGPPTANPAYLRLKSLIISLYYNSEIAMTQEIEYEHIPGRFEPSREITATTRPYAGVGGLY